MAKSKVLVVGGTGYIGRRLVRASLDQGHPTYVLPETGLDIEKLQTLLSFNRRGAHLIEGSFSDPRSLVEEVRQVDVIICAMSGVYFRSHNFLMQLKLIEAVKEAGNVKFGTNPARMGHAIEPGRVTFDEKMKVRKAIQEAKIPFTYISASCFAGYFVGSLSRLSSLTPPKDTVYLYGDGNVKVSVFLNEDDIATYTIKTIDDPRTLNKTVYLRPPENILSQRQLVDMWEKLSGRTMEKRSISAEDFLASMKGMDYAQQVGMGHFYHVFYEGCLTNFEIGEDGEEASQLYPEVQYTRMDEYQKIYT
ncbi:hypothetical protein NL676_009749 [Syzygium grande]|nr:hypothetical protein NL676_009749 [Syzygium grande]